VTLALVLVPGLAGLALWAARVRSRAVLGGAAALVLTVTLGLAVRAVLWQPSLRLRWGAGLELQLGVAGMAQPVLLLVPAVALAVVCYAAAHEDDRGLSRLVGLLLVFVGAMHLLVVADDFLTLLIGWELVGAVSWALISHEWRTHAPGQAAHAFNVTRFGDLGLFLAAGAALSATGSMSFGDAASVSGPAADVLVAGVLVAALAKSAQVPFSPWLFSAMAGPTSVSALLHSATMVAAGAYLLARLQPVLDTVPWFAPTAIGAGLATALGGGVVAALQPDAKKLLAASTSAQYGLMIIAVGAGYPLVAMAHLVAHGLYKALLFLSSGIAISAAGSRDLARMGFGPALRVTAWLTALGTLALAAVPPFGAAWTKEQIVGAAGHPAPWVGLLVIVAGTLSAFYAARFQLLAYGAPRDQQQRPAARPGLVEHATLATLGFAGLGLGVLWVPLVAEELAGAMGGTLPPGESWEPVASLAGVVLGGYAAFALHRGRRLAWPAVATKPRGRVADWFAIPELTRVTVVAPVLALARSAARFDDVVIDGAVRGVAAAGHRAAQVFMRGDDHVVDAGVRGVAALGAWAARALDRVAEVGVDGAVLGLARLIGAAGWDSRRLQSGQAHHYYAIVAIGTAVLVLATVVWR
jgi:NADH:ubiquinone oxidoreductase subunit 5 (subunit L)/multisubunit Na+/H+ antiporter MnhA subunit